MDRITAEDMRTVMDIAMGRERIATAARSRGKTRQSMYYWITQILCRAIRSGKLIEKGGKNGKTQGKWRKR